MTREELQLAIAKFTRNCVVSVIVLACLGTVLGMWGCPKYNVYRQTKKGEAELKRAEQNRKIVVETAQAQKEAEEFKAEALVINADAVAKALRTVKEELQDMTDAQARTLILYKWVEGLNDESSQVIYVPTESNLPLFLESGRVASGDGPTDKMKSVKAELERDVDEDSESDEEVEE